MNRQYETQQNDVITSDIKTFCALIARIILRCLQDHDEQTLQTLGFLKTRHEVGDDSAA